VAYASFTFNDSSRGTVGYLKDNNTKPIYNVMALIFVEGIPASVQILTDGMMCFYGLSATHIPITYEQHVLKLSAKIVVIRKK
jgi:hypothetical protein